MVLIFGLIFQKNGDSNEMEKDQKYHFTKMVTIKLVACLFLTCCYFLSSALSVTIDVALYWQLPHSIHRPTTEQAKK